MLNNSLIDAEQCTEHPPLLLDFKLIFVGCIGATIALVGVCFNILIFGTFVRSEILRHKNLIQLTCLSVCDTFVCISYIQIMSVQVYAEYFRYLPLFKLWHSYLRIAFTISHIAICSGSFLIMAAAFERYLQTTMNRKTIKLFKFFRLQRAKVAAIAFCLGVLFRGTVYFEIQIYHIDECDGFASMGVEISELARNPLFDGVWRFWTRKIATVFLPFFVLAYCNAAIVANVRKSSHEQTIKMLIVCSMLGVPANSWKVRASVRAATRSLVMVVTCYLCSNIIDVFVAAWEYLDSQSLMQLETFYTIATDVSSLLAVVSATLRLPIYLINDQVIRKEVEVTLQMICYYLLMIRCTLSMGRSTDPSEKVGIHRDPDESCLIRSTSNGYITRTNTLGAILLPALKIDAHKHETMQ